MKLTRVWFAAGLMCTLLSGCGSITTDKAVTPNGGATPTSDYVRVVERYSKGDTEYKGFHNTFAYKATALNSDMRAAILDRKTEYYKWEPDKVASEREKDAQEMQNGFEAFVSFYTPDRTTDNLADSKKTIWRVLLDVGGRRYEGKIKKSRQLLAELQELYPYHSRWNTPYVVTFEAPTPLVEGAESKFTITGPLGTRTVSFPPAANARVKSLDLPETE